MHDKIYPLPSKEFTDRRELAPELDKAFHDFCKAPSRTVCSQAS